MIKVKIEKSSDSKYNDIKEFNNLEEAFDYGLTLTNYSREIIVTKDEYNPMSDKIESFKHCDYEMEIYDDYRE